MKRFNYTAKDSNTGQKLKGSIQAENERAAGKLLLDRGLIPDRIVDDSSENLVRKLTTKITTKDRVVFTRQFATLIGAGLPLSNSLRMISDQTTNKAMKAVTEDILASVEGGKSLSDAMSQHPKVFDKVYLSLVAAGEVSGTLDESLRRIAMQQEKDAAMMSKIRGAMTYPAIVLVVIMLVVAFMMFTVVPQVQNLYEDLRQPLPALTAVMVGISVFFAQFWWLILIVLGIGVFFLSRFLQTDAGISVAANFKLNVPLFKGLFRRLYMARFARTAQILLGSGVQMLDTLNISGDAINNIVVKRSIDNAAEKVRGGKALSEGLAGQDYILPLVPQMISIGEQSGRIDEMLSKAAQVFEDELDEQIRTISTLIEPILMVVLAVVAGGMIAAILFPIYALVNMV